MSEIAARERPGFEDSGVAGTWGSGVAGPGISGFGCFCMSECAGFQDAGV